MPSAPAGESLPYVGRTIRLCGLALITIILASTLVAPWWTYHRENYSLSEAEEYGAAIDADLLRDAGWARNAVLLGLLAMGLAVALIWRWDRLGVARIATVLLVALAGFFALFASLAALTTKDEVSCEDRCRDASYITDGIARLRWIVLAAIAYVLGEAGNRILAIWPAIPWNPKPTHGWIAPAILAIAGLGALATDWWHGGISPFVSGPDAPLNVNAGLFDPDHLEPIRPDVTHALEGYYWGVIALFAVAAAWGLAIRSKRWRTRFAPWRGPLVLFSIVNMFWLLFMMGLPGTHFRGCQERCMVSIDIGPGPYWVMTAIVVLLVLLAIQLLQRLAPRPIVAPLPLPTLASALKPQGLDPGSPSSRDRRRP